MWTFTSMHSYSGAQMEVSGQYYTLEKESLVPDTRLGGLDAE